MSQNLSFSALLSKYKPATTNGTSTPAVPNKPTSSSTTTTTSARPSNPPPRSNTTTPRPTTTQPRPAASSGAPNASSPSTGTTTLRAPPTTRPTSSLPPKDPSSRPATTNSSSLASRPAASLSTSAARPSTTAPRLPTNGTSTASASSTAPKRPAPQEDPAALERKRKLIEAMKRKKEKAAADAAAEAAAAEAAAKAGKPAPPKPESYHMMLARAKEKYESQAKQPGIIQHKARAPVEEKKEWQKKLASKNGTASLTNGAKSATGTTAADRKSKSPGVTAAAGKGLGARKINDPGKPGATAKKTDGKKDDKDNGRRPIQRAVIPPSRWEKKYLEEKGKRKRADTTPRGKYSAYSSGSRKSKYANEDEYDEEDDFVVPDDDDDEAYGGYAKRYRYASDYDTDSDMEATGADVLEEEERARRIAIKEDLEQERLEQEAAERKRKMLRKG